LFQSRHIYDPPPKRRNTDFVKPFTFLAAAAWCNGEQNHAGKAALPSFWDGRLGQI
jgi:hypothetical protein